MGRRYTEEEKEKAIKLYEKLGHITWAMAELGYPTSRTLLYAWIKDYKENGTCSNKKRSKYTEEQRQRAVEYFKSHGMSVAKTITDLGYPGRTLMNEWLKEDLPREKGVWSCNSHRKVVRYSQEQKYNAVEMYCSGKKPKEISEELSVNPASIRVWYKQLLDKAEEKDMKTQKPLPSSEISEQTADDLKEKIHSLESEKAQLEKEVFRLQMQKDILETAGEILKKENGIYLEKISNKEKTDVIDALRNKYRLRNLLCELKISKSSYCYQRANKLKTDKYYELRKRITEIFNQNYKSYGYRRIYGVLIGLEIRVSEKVIRRLMKEEGLVVKASDQGKYSSYKGEITPEVPNLIARDFHAEKPNQKWLTDITEFHIPAGKVYLSPMLDCFDGKIVTWTVGTSPDAELTNTMLDEAVLVLGEDEHPIIHSDRGCHYRWPGWIERMDRFHLIRSMSKKACSPDNSACEGFFGRLKNEMFYGRSWAGVSLEDFICAIDDYIHWYNERRIKKSLGYLSPAEYRMKMLT